MDVIRNCRWCDQPWQVSTKYRRYCSDECRRKAERHDANVRQRGYRDAKCKRCRQVYERTSAGQRFCSERCRVESSAVAHFVKAAKKRGLAPADVSRWPNRVPLLPYEIDQGSELAAEGWMDEVAMDRPNVRSECAALPRPCPFVGCRFNLSADVEPDGTLRTGLCKSDENCVLDHTDNGPMTLQAMGALLKVSRERIRQIEESGLERLRIEMEKIGMNRALAIGLGRPGSHMAQIQDVAPGYDPKAWATSGTGKAPPMKHMSSWGHREPRKARMELIRQVAKKIARTRGGE